MLTQAQTNQAFEALKKRDFHDVLTVMGKANMAAFISPHFLIKGLAELSLAKWADAHATFTAAITRFPDDTLFWLNKGLCEENLGLIVAAVASQEKAVQLNPAQGEAWGNLANLYCKQKRFVDSEQAARKALEFLPVKTDALNSLGLALGKMGRYGEAEAAFHTALGDAPTNAFVLLNRANLAVDQLRFDQAWGYFAAARAVAHDPTIDRDEGLARLLCGDLKRGWELSEARLRMPNALRLIPTAPLWRGENLVGKKLLIIAEQGFGDVIQFCRYDMFLPDGDLIWAVPQNLVRLLSGAVRGTVMCEKDILPVCDYYVPMMSLPWVLGQYEPLLKEGYIKASSLPALPHNTTQQKIGLVWAGSRTHDRDYERSIPLRMFASWIQNTQAAFYAPFVGAALDEIGDLPMTRLDHLCGDFADAAALIAQLDCLITVDTVAAHLGGALGVKTFVLLPYCPDWRWGVSGEGCAWYWSVTLLRQPKPGDWQGVMDLLKRRF